MSYIRPRVLEKRVALAARVMPVVVVLGARQTGKTTLVRRLDPGRAYATLDDLGVLEQAQMDPESLLALRPIAIDEVQRSPDLLLAVKRAVDERRRPGDFLLTGSANLLLMAKVSESLAGRAIYFDLPPFCPPGWNETSEQPLRPLDRLFSEDFEPAVDWPVVEGDLPGWLLRGGFPPALEIEDDSERALWFAAYVQTYLERDLRQLSDVSSLVDFQRLMRLLALRTGRLLNQADLARDAALSHATAHRYLNLLETSCLLVRLRPYATLPAASIVKTPKVFWADSGLAAWLAGITTRNEVTGRDDIGYWLEQAIFQTLQVWKAAEPDQRQLYFWRNRSGSEVDFILEEKGFLVPLEVKLSSQAYPTDGTAIVAFAASLNRKKLLRRSVVLYGGRDVRKLREGIYALPWRWMLPGTSDVMVTVR